LGGRSQPLEREFDGQFSGGDMPIGIAFLIIGVVVITAAIGATRVEFARKPGLEGIEDREAAEAYDRISGWPQFALLRRMILRRLWKLHPAGRLADIGCGPGRLVALIARQDSRLQVIGIDTAEEMIRTAKSSLASLGLSDRVEFRKGEVGCLPFADGEIDFAVSTLSLHHWTDPKGGLAEIARVLKPGGDLVLFDLRRDPRRFFYWLLNFAQALVVPNALRQVKEPLGSMLASYTPDEMAGILGETPFKEVKIEAGVGWMFILAKNSQISGAGG
jgi:ubiquinone/menaquinone biosynthesis C-methylase UbiE